MKKSKIENSLVLFFFCRKGTLYCPKGLWGGDIQGEHRSSWTSCGGPGPIEEGSRVFVTF